MHKRQGPFCLWMLPAGWVLAGAGVLACKADAATTVATACEHAYTRCAGDPPPSAQDLTDCAQALNGPCGSLMQLYVVCVTGKCSDAGHADHGAIGAQCATQFQAYRECAASVVDAGAAADTSTGFDEGVVDDTGTPDDTGAVDDAAVDVDAAVDAETGALEAGE